MLIFALLACSGQANPPEERIAITVETLRWSWGYEQEPLGAVHVRIDDHDGNTQVGTTDGGIAVFDVNPDDGPFTISAVAYDQWPHAMTRMGLAPTTDETVTFTFSAQEYQLPTVMLWGTAMPRHEGSNLLVTVHQPDLLSTFDGTGFHWFAPALPDEPYRMLATEYVQHNHGDRGEYTRDFYGWYRYVRGAPHEDTAEKLLLTDPIVPHRAGGQLEVTDEFAGPFARMEANVYSGSSAWHTPCGYTTLAARTPDADGWFWAMEWATPKILAEDLVTQVWVTAPGVATTSLRPYAPADLGDVEMLPAPHARGHLRGERTMYVFGTVPEDARPVAYVVDRDAPSRVLWAIEGPPGQDRFLRPEPPDAALLPDVALATIPAIVRHGTEDTWFDQDMSWGPMFEATPTEPMTPGEIPGVALR